MKKILLLFLFTFSTGFIFAYNELKVLDPQSWWDYGEGTIDSVSLEITPKGIYLQYELYLTFSANGLGFSSETNYETEYEFDLPEGAVVNDLWLWVGDEIMKADILDTWTASSIYEGIVNRRRDPAILFKRSATQYELRVYPMVGDGSRRIKLTYLMPADWNRNSVTAALPVGMLQCSRTLPQNLAVIYHPVPGWGVPAIAELPSLEFREISTEKRGTVYTAEIESSNLSGNLTLTLTSPMQNGIYLSRSGNSEDGYYQMAFLPGENISAKGKKISFLIDYENNGTDLSKSDLVSTLKSAILNMLTEKDSFNIHHTGLETVRLSENWFGCDSASVENAFSNFTSDIISDYSNLPSLLNDGIEFVSNKKEGEIILISNSDNYGDNESANALIKDIREILPENTRITIADFSTLFYPYFYINNHYYYRNEYLYSNLARVSGGNYYNARDNDSYSADPDLNEFLSSAIQSLEGVFNSFDLYTTTEGGFCYGRFSGNPRESVYINKALTQVGRFYGNFPFTVQASGLYDNEVFNFDVSVGEEEASVSDSTLENYWNGKYIQSLEKEQSDNDLINEVINISIEERILSFYTAFLALEPGMEIEGCLDCNDDTEILISVDSTEIADDYEFSIRAWPNPFNPTTTINFALAKAGHVSLKVYNSLGQEVAILVDGFKAAQSYQVEFDASSLTSGIYYYTLQTENMNQTMKMLLVK